MQLSRFRKKLLDNGFKAGYLTRGIAEMSMDQATDYILTLKYNIMSGFDYHTICYEINGMYIVFDAEYYQEEINIESFEIHEFAYQYGYSDENIREMFEIDFNSYGY